MSDYLDSFSTQSWPEPQNTDGWTTIPLMSPQAAEVLRPGLYEATILFNYDGEQIDIYRTHVAQHEAAPEGTPT